MENRCQQIPPSVLHRLHSEDFPQFQDFPYEYEGTAVYVTRHHEWEEEIGDNDHAWIADLQNTLRKLPEPLPYLAVLVANGDKIGAAISNLPDAAASRAFSHALSGFAEQARQIVRDHHGVLVYAGRDDVLAFLPVDRCLPCARELRDRFLECLQPEVPEKTPTLSIGLAIGHFLENLEDLLEYGRTAKKAAKNVEGTDALAVHLHKRNDTPIRTAARWDTQPEKRLTLYAELIQLEALPGQLSYDLGKLIDLYEASDWPDDQRREALQHDALRIIADKQPQQAAATWPTFAISCDNVKPLRIHRPSATIC